MQRPILLVPALVAGLVSGCVSAAGEAAPPAGPAARPPVVMVVGDSFTVGSGPVPEWESYAAEAARTLDWQVIMAGGRGSGFTAPGRIGRTFAQSFTRELSWRPAPDMVLLSGGHNDREATKAEVRAAALALVEKVRKLWPSVKVVIVGPIWMTRPPKSAYRVRDALARAAWLAGAPFIDPLSQQWTPAGAGPARASLGGSTSRGSANGGPKLLLPDGTHPTAFGHLQLARWLVGALRLRGLAPEPAGNAASVPVFAPHSTSPWWAPY
ncbi:SGNH/GDSL hydrolase family protein [Streptosporangiaceae bacterium NEAU-GS5]|nr:SGNH/GDSL hydrolase family protein [Streptosporangiaceae bacterium NEAU-GS5]